MKIIKNLLVISFIISTLANCSKEEAQIPAYLNIPDINFNANQGSDSEKITQAFVYVNDNFIGGYELPTTIPVLTQGEATVLIEAGVEANGVAETPDVYPFYKIMEQQIDFKAEETISITPTTTYKDNVKFAVNENFSSAAQLFTVDLDNDPITRIEITNIGAFEGNSAKVTLTEDNPNIIVATDFTKNDLSVLPQNGSAVWLELDYKTDVPILFGMVGIDRFGDPTEFPEYGVNIKNEWNKIYFDVTNFIQRTEFVGFQVFFVAAHSGEGEKNIFLDNIKLAYFD